MALRKILHGMGYRYRLHVRKLPGTPDIVFPGRRRVIFVHGCFWHGHKCRPSLEPKSRVEFWRSKVARNVERDQRTLADLKDTGWAVMVVWECELSTRRRNDLVQAVHTFLDQSVGHYDVHPMDSGPVKPGIADGHLKNLTVAQRTALTRFEPKVWSPAFPDVNPQTASALWRLGLLKGKAESGKRLFRLTDEGKSALDELNTKPM